MRLSRRHTRPGHDPFDGTALRAFSGENGLECRVPKSWGAEAAEALAEHGFFKGLVPARTRPAPDAALPAFLLPSEKAGEDVLRETDVRAVLSRLAGSWACRAFRAGTLAEEEARVFHDELRHLLLHNVLAPEPGLWSAGLDWAYGLPPAPFTPARRTQEFMPAGARHALEHAEAGERRLALAGERAALVLPARHADGLSFVRWKQAAEFDAIALELGRRALAAALHRVMDACDRDDPAGGFNPLLNAGLARAAGEALRLGAGEAAVETAISLARQGHESLNAAHAVPARAPDAALPVLSLDDDFIEAALTDRSVLLEAGAEPRHAPASALWDALAEAVWSSAAPGVLFEGNAGGPGLAQDFSGGFIFPPGHAAPACTLNLLACLGDDGMVDAEAVRHAVQIALIALDLHATGPQRPVVISLTHVSALLHARGTAYDSDAGRTEAALLCALVTGCALEASAQLAEKHGAFDGCARKDMAQSLRAMAERLSGRTGLARSSVQVKPALCRDKNLASAAQEALARAGDAVRAHGLRHAHLTAIDTENAVQVLLNGHAPGIAPPPRAAPEALVRMKAAVEPFLSGGAAHVVELPQDASIDDVQRLLRLGWELGVKNLRLWRAGSSLLGSALAREDGEDAAWRAAS